MECPHGEMEAGGVHRAAPSVEKKDLLAVAGAAGWGGEVARWPGGWVGWRAEWSLTAKKRGGWYPRGGGGKGFEGRAL